MREGGGEGEGEGQEIAKAVSLPQPTSATDSTILKPTTILPESRVHGPAGEASPLGGVIGAQRRSGGVSDTDMSSGSGRMSLSQFPRSSTQIFPSTPARNATDLLLAEFLAAAPVGDERMTATVKRGLHEVLLLEFGSESIVDLPRQIV